MALLKCWLHGVSGRQWPISAMLLSACTPALWLMWRCRAANIGVRADVSLSGDSAARPLAEHGMLGTKTERSPAPCCVLSCCQLPATPLTVLLRWPWRPAGRFAEDGSPEARKQRTQGPGYAAKNAGYPLRLSGPQTGQQGLPLDPQQVSSPSP